jgi:hypothetical protein
MTKSVQLVMGLVEVDTPVEVVVTTSNEVESALLALVLVGSSSAASAPATARMARRQIRICERGGP